MKLIIDIPEELRERLFNIVNYGMDIATGLENEMIMSIVNGTPISDNATNGDVIKAMFGDDKVSEFMYHTRILAKVGNWFNEGVVAEFDNVWLNAPYQKGDINRKNCDYRHENGNCLKVGGFCTSVDNEYCMKGGK